MADSIALEIVTPDGIKLNERVGEVTAPSVNGEFGVLPGHRPMLAALATGLVTYTIEGQKREVAVGAGFAEVVDDKVILLTDRFSTKQDIDPVIVRKELKETDEVLERFQGDPSSPEYAALIAQELWLAAQLDLYGDPPPPRLRTQNEIAYGTVESYRDAPEGTPAEISDGKSEAV